MHFYAWKNGLKTGMYYLRTRPAVDAIKFTLNVEELLKATDGNNSGEVLKAMNKMEHINDDLKKKQSTTNTDNTVKTIEYKKVEDEEGCINCSG